MKILINYTILISLVTLITACGGGGSGSNSSTEVSTADNTPVNAVSGEGSNESDSLVSVLKSDEKFTTLVSALESTGLDAMLSDDTELTLFAPTNEAFSSLDKDVLSSLLADTDALQNVLQYHLVDGEVDADMASELAGQEVTTMNGQAFAISGDEGVLYVNLAKVVRSNLAAGNGVIHAIDKVLLPPKEKENPTDTIVDTAINAGSFTTLVAALQATGLDEALANTESTFTVFAPTDDAFALLGQENIDTLLANPDVLAEILQQHVIAGDVDSIKAFSLAGQAVETIGGSGVDISIVDSALRYGGAKVVTTDIFASNGIIHVIDMVVVNDVELPAPAESILDIALSGDDFTTLVAALEATGLDSLLDDTSKTFTVFAPTDAAFAELGDDQIAAFLNDPEKLASILTYHVVTDAAILADAAVAAAMSSQPNVATANGNDIALSLLGESLFVNLSEVVQTNLLADNGVIHVLDKVLLPPAEVVDAPSLNIVDTALAAGTFTTLVAALQATGLDEVLADEHNTFTVFAPTDEAFAKLPEGVLDILLGYPDALGDILKQHVVADAAVDALTAFTLNGKSVDTVGGIPVEIRIVDGSLTIGGATISTTDIRTTNGIIHVIDSVIVGDVAIPEPEPSIADIAANNANFSILTAALQATGLDEILDDLNGEFTVFAPTDDAFNALGQDTIDALLDDPEALRDILLYHVLVGEVFAEEALAVANSHENIITAESGDRFTLTLSADQLYVNLSRVVDTDIDAANGVVHVLDKVLLPPVDKGHPELNIVETAIADGRFTQLVEALSVTGLAHALANEHRHFTVFAPTDDAFAKIPEATLNALFHNRHALARLLTQHVISDSEVDSITALSLNGQSVNTAAHEDVTIEIVDNQLQIQGANVVIFDVYTSNGVIHVIDTVITETLH